MCDIDDCGGFSSVTRQRARKGYTCCACYEAIPASDRYVTHSGAFDGSFFRTRHCLRCWEIVERLTAIICEPVVTTLDCDADPLPEGSPLDWLAFATRDEMQALEAGIMTITDEKLADEHPEDLAERTKLGLTADQYDRRLDFERECACHINPPCSNCIEHSQLFPEEC